MNRRPFDLGLWVLCTAPAFAFFGGALALNVWDRGWRADDHVAAVAVLVVLGLLLGFGLYDGCRRLGVRVSRPRPDQAADYEDER